MRLCLARLGCARRYLGDGEGHKRRQSKSRRAQEGWPQGV